MISDRDLLAEDTRAAIIRDYLDFNDFALLQEEADLCTLGDVDWEGNIRQIQVYEVDIGDTDDLQSAQVRFLLTVPAAAPQPSSLDRAYGAAPRCLQHGAQLLRALRAA